MPEISRKLDNISLGIQEDQGLELIFAIATLLGGITALWFLVEKRDSILRILTFKTKKIIPESLFEISDEDFSFIDENLQTLNGDGHTPINTNEAERCISLLNAGVLERLDSGAYKLRKKAKSLFFETSA